MLASDRFRSSAELYNNYGAALLEVSRYRPAAEAFEQALALDGDRETAAIGLARALAATEGPGPAREQLSAWCRAHLEADRAWTALVRLNGKMGDASAALAAAKEHALRRPDSAVRVAAALVEVGEREGAMALLRAHLVRHPEDGSARALLGGIQSGRGAPEARAPGDTPEGVAPPESTAAEGAERPAHGRDGSSGGDR
jgi:thioredoxin-like negative regulator of GroEL